MRTPTMHAATVVLLVVVLTGSACSRGTTRSVDAFCTQMEAAQGLDESLGNLDLEALRPQYDALKKAERVAPTEIQPEVATLTGITGQLVHTLETTSGDRATAIEDTMRDQQGDLASVRAAGDAVQTYTQANCGIELNANSGTSGTNGTG